MQITTYRDLPYPANLWSAVFQREHSKEDIPKDWRDVLESVLPTLRDERRGQMLCYYFQQHLTLNQIGEIYGMTREAVRQHINRAISLLRKPAKKQVMRLGLKTECTEKRQKNCCENIPPSSSSDKEILEMLIEELDISTKITNALYLNNVYTVRELTTKTETDLRTFRNIGVASIEEIKRVLAHYELQLASDKKEESVDNRPLLNEKEIPLNVLAMYVTDLKMSNRATNVLKRNNILTVKKLITMTESELRALHGLGEHSMKEIKACLEQFRTAVTK